MTRRVRSASPFEASYRFCRALRVGDVIHVAGTAPIPQDGSSPPVSAYEQMLLAGAIALSALEEAQQVAVSATEAVDTVAEEEATAVEEEGAEQLDEVEADITDPADADDVGTAHGELFAAGEPVATMVVVAALLDPRWKVELEIEALIR